MKKILLISSILGTLIFTGCGSVNPNLPQSKADVKHYNISVKEDGEIKFTNLKGSETLVQVAYKLEGKHRSVYKIVVPAINKVNAEVEKRGYKYFQIVSPKAISNLEGFPVNNKADLATFLNPSFSMPRHTLSLLETRKTLMDNQNSQNVVDVPFLIFNDTEFNFIIRMIKEPQNDEIVWNIKG